MLVFVDESGDLGYKLDGGSSRFFTIALVLFEDVAAARSCQQAIERHRDTLFLSAGHEFKFHSDSHERRLALLSILRRHTFFCYTFTLNKASPKLRGPGLRYRSTGYKWVCSTALENAAADLRRAKIVIDGSGDRRFRKEMSTYLKRRINEPGQQQIHDVRISQSHSDVLLQLADYVAGVTNRWHEGKPGAEVYERYLHSKWRSQRKWP